MADDKTLQLARMAAQRGAVQLFTVPPLRLPDIPPSVEARVRDMAVWKQAVQREIDHWRAQLQRQIREALANIRPD